MDINEMQEAFLQKQMELREGIDITDGFVPNVFFFDGNGYLHPRHMGIATHASFYLKRPTVGIAKSYFRVDRDTDYKEPENEVGCFTDIVIDGETYGRVLRTHKNVRPVFVSVSCGL